MPSELDQLSSLDTDALLRELVSRYDVEQRLYSPEGFAARARAIIAKLMQSAKSAICNNKEVLEAPEVELATTLIGLLQGTLPEQLVVPFALYVAKVGVRQVCHEYGA